MHARQQIRDAIAEALSGLPGVGSNVFTTRIYKLEAFPALVVYTLQEDAARETMSPRKQSRVLRVAIDIAVMQTDDPDAALDDIAASVEAKIEEVWQAASGIWGSIRDITLNSTVVAMSGEGEQRALGMSLTYSCNYRTLEGAPETIIS